MASPTAGVLGPLLFALAACAAPAAEHIGQPEGRDGGAARVRHPDSGGGPADGGPMGSPDAGPDRSPRIVPALRSACPASEPDPSAPFADVTTCAGIDAFNAAHDLRFYMIGQAWGDYDADGLLDLYVTSPAGENVLYRNAGDGTFDRSPVAADVALVEHESAGAVFADVDDDGFPDLFVVGVGANHLFHNDGGRGFVDVTREAGVDDWRRGQTATFGDYDRDGYLDLYVANWFCGCGSSDDRDDRLYHNEGDGTFADVTHLLGPEVGGPGFAATFVDYDGDGDADLYVANDQGLDFELPEGTWRNVLWRNDGPGCGGWCFTEAAAPARADLRIDSMGLAIGDVDNDADLDLFVSNSPPHHVLLRNEGNGTFTDLREGAGLSTDPLGGSGWGTALFDYDNDGWQDVYLAIGPGPNALFRNLGDGTFADVSSGSGADDPDDSLGVAYADYDHDGRVDVVVGNRGWDYRLYRNVSREAAARRWLALRLVGGGPINRDAVGARAYVRTTDGVERVGEVVCGSSLGAGNGLDLHFGLGDARLERVLIVWPDGTTSVPAVTDGHTWRIAYPGG